MNFFASDTTKTALKSLSEANKSFELQDTIIPSIQKEIDYINHSYKQLLDAYEIGRSISDSYRPLITNLQVSTLFQLANSFQTAMIRDLQYCFANAQYSEIIKVLNATLSLPRIEAPDVSFIKTSKLVNILEDDLTYPRGFSSSLRDLNKSTAEGIANSNELQYDTGNNLFISSSGFIDSKGLNVVNSGKEIFTFESNEIFTEGELIDFASLLSSTPMLALSVQTGRKIYDFLKGLYQSGEKSINFDKELYYHCRSHKSDVMPFTYNQMLMAPYGLPWAGRYNQVGRSNYYFADSRNGAEAEVKKHKANDDVLQTVILRPKKDINLLDLSGTLSRGTTFLRYLRFSLTDLTDKMPREYLIPCFVSDCCKALGFDGIKYYGSKDYSNYVTWNDGYFEYVSMCE